MDTKDPLGELEMNTYDVAVPLDLSVFDTPHEAKLAVVETVARSIIADVDHLDDGDETYVTTQVEFDEDALEDAFDDDEIGIAKVETKTQLANVGDD